MHLAKDDRDLTGFKKALQLSDPDWTHRRQVEIDIKAVEDWKARQ